MKQSDVKHGADVSEEMIKGIRSNEVEARATCQGYSHHCQIVPIRKRAIECCEEFVLTEGSWKRNVQQKCFLFS